jgi:predicted ABC-class ATPase
VANADDLRQILRRIDGRGYKAYSDLRGAFDFPQFRLFVDHVQADPFATPSHLRARFPIEIAGLPEALRSSRVRRVALADFLAREVSAAFAEPSRATPSPAPGRHRSAAGRGGSEQGRRGRTGNSGSLQIDAGAQVVLERSAVHLTDDFVEARIQVGLPATGRRILGREAEELLLQSLPPALCKGLLWAELPQREAERFVETVENQEHLRGQLASLDLVAFVANGSVLPRRSGASDLPMSGDSALPFRSPAAFEQTLELPNPTAGATGKAASITGMGIPQGVTLIVGGGYHGKSTLLQALENCVHPHIPGDGREGVVCSASAVKVRAEDGRFVGGVDIAPFIGELPGGRDTRRFSSDDASGSTSQASSIVEALEVGAKTLLIDEDTSATNFMVRDARMRQLIHDRDEPITPFIDRVRELHREHGVSTVLVMGGVGDYFAVADQVIALRDYRPLDVTARAHEIAEQPSATPPPEHPAAMQAATPRVPLGSSFDASRGRRPVKIDARSLDQLGYGTQSVDLRGVAQLQERSQTLAIGHAIHLASERFMHGDRDLSAVLDELEQLLDEQGVDALNATRRGESHPGNLARPRRFEIAAAINRMRSLRVR